MKGVTTKTGRMEGREESLRVLPVFPSWWSRFLPFWPAAAMTFVVLFFGTDLFSRKNALPIIWWIESLFGWRGISRPGGEMGTEEGLLRKTAHLLEYGLLALAWLQACSAAWPRWRRIAFAFLACIAVAALDELQQGFVASHRTGSPWDVLVDASGAAAALVIAMFVIRRQAE